MRRTLIPLLVALGSTACGGGGASPMAPTAVATPTPAPSPAATPAPTPSPAATPTPAPPPSPAPTPTPSATPTPRLPSGPTVLRTARMRGANGHNASGTVRIVAKSGGFVLEFLQDFRINGGSNDIYLARTSSLDMSRDLRVAELRSISGAQSYDLPNDGSGYSFVILYCRPFRIPIGIGELQ